MGHNYTIFIYLLTYYFRFRSGTRVPVVLPGGYPGNKLPGYGSPNHNNTPNSHCGIIVMSSDLWRVTMKRRSLDSANERHSFICTTNLYRSTSH